MNMARFVKRFPQLLFRPVSGPPLERPAQHEEGRQSEKNIFERVVHKRRNSSQGARQNEGTEKQAHGAAGDGSSRTGST